MAYQLNQEKGLLLSYRKACKKHTVTFELRIQEDTKRHLFALNDRVQRAGNEVSTTMQKRIDQMRRTKAYRKLCRDYEWKTEHMKDLNPDCTDYQALAEGRRKTVEALSSMQRDFGIIRGEVQALIQKKAQLCSIPPAIASTLGDDIWREIEKVLRTGNKALSIQEREDFPVMRARNIREGILLKIDETKDRLVVCMDGFPDMPLLVPKKDIFLQDEYSALLGFLKYPEQEMEKAEQYQKTGIAEPVFRPCFCSICCRVIRRKLRCYVKIRVCAGSLKRKKSVQPERSGSTPECNSSRM